MAGTQRQILVLGATGPSGLAFLEKAVTIPDLHLLIYARNPSKIPNSLLQHAQLTVLPGSGSITDGAAIQDAIALLHPTDMIVSFLGPPASQILAWMNPFSQEGKGPVFANAYSIIVDAMKRVGVRRIFALGTISIVEKEDKTDFKACTIVWIVRLLFNRGWRNMVEIGKFFDKVPAEEIDWTVFRVGLLCGGEPQSVTDGYLGDGKTTPSIRRRELADWLVGQVTNEDAKWVGQKPIVSTNKGATGG